MGQADRPRKVYPSDLMEEQWTIVEPLIPPAKQSPRGGRPREVDMREVLNTIFSLNRSGGQWDMLPHDLLPKSTGLPCKFDFHASWCPYGDMGVLSQSSIFGAKSKNRVSEIQRLTDCQTLEKATLRQNRLNCLKYDELLTRFCQLVDHPF